MHRQHLSVYTNCKKQSTKPQCGFRLLEINNVKLSERDASWQVLQDTKG